MAATLFDNYSPALVSSSASLTQSTTSTSFVDVTNSSISFVNRRGRPVLLALFSDSGDASIEADPTANTGACVIQFVRGSTVLSINHLETNDGDSSFADLKVPPGAVWFIDTPGVGSFTYKLQFKTLASGSDSAHINNCKFYVVEL